MKTVSGTTKKTAKKTVAKKEVAAAPAAKKTVAKKESAPAAKKEVVVKKEAAPAVKKAPAKKVAAEKPVAKKETAVKKAPAKKVAAEKPVAKKETAVKKAPAKKAAVSVAKKEAEAPVRSSRIKKLKLNKGEKKHYIELLKNLRKEFVSQLRFHQDDALSTKKDAAGERAGMATHMADLGSDNFRHDVELGLLSDEADVILMIDEALQRIEDSEYGICIECGCLIAPARLEAKPYARFCTKCKSRHEEMEDPGRRHR